MKNIEKRIEVVYKDLPVLQTIKDPNVEKVVELLKKNDTRDLLNDKERIENLERLIKLYKEKFKAVVIKLGKDNKKQKLNQEIIEISSDEEADFHEVSSSTDKDEPSRTLRNSNSITKTETNSNIELGEHVIEMKNVIEINQQNLIPSHKIKTEKLDNSTSVCYKNNIFNDKETLFTRRNNISKNNNIFRCCSPIEILDSDDEAEASNSITINYSNPAVVQKDIKIENIKSDVIQCNESSIFADKSLGELEEIFLNLAEKLDPHSTNNIVTPDSTSTENNQENINRNRATVVSQEILPPSTHYNILSAVLPAIINLSSSIHTPTLQFQPRIPTTISFPQSSFNNTEYYDRPIRPVMPVNSVISSSLNHFHDIPSFAHSGTNPTTLSSVSIRNNLQTLSEQRMGDKRKSYDGDLPSTETVPNKIVITNVRTLSKNYVENPEKTIEKPARITKRRYTYHTRCTGLSDQVDALNNTREKLTVPKGISKRRNSECCYNKKIGQRELKNLRDQFNNYHDKEAILSSATEHRAAFDAALKKIRRSSKTFDREEKPLNKEKSKIPPPRRRKSVNFPEHERDLNQKCDIKNSLYDVWTPINSVHDSTNRISTQKNIKLVLKRMNSKTLECNSNQQKTLEIQPFATISSILDDQNENQSKKPDTRNKTFKNTNLKLNCYDTNFMSKCVVCDKASEDLVSHYVNHHSDIPSHEIYCSRLPFFIINKYKEKTLEAKLIRSSNPAEYKCECVFCGNTISGFQTDFLEHYSTHTGEYPYACDKCDKKTAFKKVIFEHCKNFCKNGGEPKEIYSYREQNEIKALFCAECKFIQLNKSNVIKHLQNHHNIEREPERLCDNLVLVKFYERPRSLSVEEMFEQNFSELKTENPRKQNIDEVNEIRVCNEPITDNINEQINDQTKIIDAIFPDDNRLKSIKPVLNSDKNNNKIEENIPSLHKNSKKNVAVPIKSIPAFGNMRIMKPWLNNKEIDRDISKINAILSKVNLADFFKCMLCPFSTNLADQMLKHIRNHSNQKNMKFECCYCNEVFNTPEFLINHMKIIHDICNFQCSICFYRSCSPNNVKIHIEKYHEKADKIIACDGPEISISEQFKEIIEGRSEYMKPYVCHLCNKDKYEFYLRDDLKDHFKRSHPNSLFCKCIYHGLFSCFFCNFETDEIERIKIHIADYHSNKELFVAARLRNPKLNKQINSRLKDSTVILELSKVLLEDNFLESRILTKKLKNVFENAKQFRILAENSNETVWGEKDYLSNESFKYCSSHPHLAENNSIKKLETDFLKMANSLVSYTCAAGKNSSHQYICYLCGTIDSTLKNIQRHFNKKHKNMSQIKTESFEQYKIVIPNKICDSNKNSKQKLLAHVLCILKIRKHEYKTSKKPKIANDKKLLLPKYITLEKGRYKCFEKNCSYIAPSENELFERHLKCIHRTLKHFECSHCAFRIDEEIRDFDNIKNHLRMHSEILYICTKCPFYHHQRQIVQRHVRSIHKVEMNITNITRSYRNNNEEYSFTTCLEDKKTFIEQRYCTICGTDLLKSKNFMKHLKIEHSIKIMYECQYCNNIYESLDTLLEHSKKEHLKKPYKIRCKYEYKKNKNSKRENSSKHRNLQSIKKHQVHSEVTEGNKSKKRPRSEKESNVNQQSKKLKTSTFSSTSSYIAKETGAMPTNINQQNRKLSSTTSSYIAKKTACNDTKNEKLTKYPLKFCT